ncbi:MAG: Mut7-C RNAse domain-containing protein [Candidatus Omnitrophica bacterium]|nr:Mut7-C RNAse domain-containing protein [Candidatus Omnitrophota bacterium]
MSKIKVRLLLTRELGRLAKWLRILGLDTVYFKEQNVSSLIIEALRQERIIITRNHHLPRSCGARIVVINAERLNAQLAEVLKRLQIKPVSDMMFTRCTLCNEPLTAIQKENAKDKVPAYVFAAQERFFACPQCSRIYWQGSHWGNVREILNKINS